MLVLLLRYLRRESNWGFLLLQMGLDFLSPKKMRGGYNCAEDTKVDGRNPAGLLDGILSWDLMYMDIKRDILMSLHMPVRIWRSGDLSWRNLRLSQMRMGYISSTFLDYQSTSRREPLVFFGLQVFTRIRRV